MAVVALSTTTWLSTAQKMGNILIKKMLWANQIFFGGDHTWRQKRQQQVNRQIQNFDTIYAMIFTDSLGFF